jgi:DNA-binding transcriptional regulator YhcF (GntR family)
MSMSLYRLARAITLPPTEKAILIALCDRMNDQTMLCCPSYEQIAVDTGFERSTVNRTLKKLKDRGLIDWQTVRRRGQFGFNVYIIHQVALSHAANSHAANSHAAKSKSTKLHRVQSPSCTEPLKPLNKPLEKPLYDNNANKRVKAQKTLTESQINYASNLTKRYMKKFAHEHYEYEQVKNWVYAYLKGDQNQGSWAALGTGLPPPDEI